MSSVCLSRVGYGTIGIVIRCDLFWNIRYYHYRGALIFLSVVRVKFTLAYEKLSKLEDEIYTLVISFQVFRI